MGAKASIFAGALKRKDEQTGVLVVRGEHQYKSEVHGKVDINLSESDGSEQNNFGIQNNLRYSVRAVPGKSTLSNLKNNHQQYSEE